MLDFNNKQEQAIAHMNGVCSVIAAAGSGKTAVLIERVHRLVLSGAKQQDILVVSFTNDISKELNKKLDEIGLSNVDAGTFHSIARNMLMEQGIVMNPKDIISDWKVAECFKTINKNLKKGEISDIKGYIDYQKVYMRTHKDKFVYKKCDIPEDDLREYFRVYEEYKVKNKLYDFTDWLLICYEMGKNKISKHNYLLCDESQDNNYLRNLLIKQWGSRGNVFYVGDYRQAIFGFNGAMPEMFMNLDKEWDNIKIINMDINYRSCANIVYNANNFIRKYYGDYKYYKDSIPHNKENGKIECFTYYSSMEEGLNIVDKISDLINLGDDINDIAVLYRNNAQADYVENELRKREIKYCISENKGFFDRKEVKLIVSYLKLLEEPHNDENFDTLFNLRNKPIMFIKKKDYEMVKYESGRHNSSLYESFIYHRFDDERQNKSVREFESNIEWLRLQKEKPEITVSKLIDNIVKIFDINKYIEDNFETEEIEGRKNSINVLKDFARNNNLKKFIGFTNGNVGFKKKDEGVKLMTVHAAKGLQFKHVFVISIEDKKFPSERADVVEEARLFYVSITRSKDNLYLSQIGNRNQFIKEYGF